MSSNYSALGRGAAARRIAQSVFLAWWILLLPAGATAAEQVAPARPSLLAEQVRTLLAKDLRVASVAYRLQTAASGLCDDRTRLSGLIVQDASQYRPDLRSVMASYYGLRERPAVIGLVPNSPGERAGVKVGDTLLGINGQDLSYNFSGTERETSNRFDLITRKLDAAFRQGPVGLLLARNGAPFRLLVIGTPACASRIQLSLSSKRNAEADGEMITVTQGLVDFVDNDDELAFLIGHELSHNLLGHRRTLDGPKAYLYRLFAGVRSRAGLVRATEEQADYYGLYIAALGGYKIQAAARLWRRWDRADPFARLVRDRSHPTNVLRAARLDSEVYEIESKRRSGAPLVPTYDLFIRCLNSHSTATER